MSFDPRDDRARLCSQCESRDAVDGELCGLCAVQACVDDGEYALARAIAVTHGVTHETVERMIREVTEKLAALETNAMHAAVGRMA